MEEQDFEKELEDMTSEFEKYISVGQDRGLEIRTPKDLIERIAETSDKKHQFVHLCEHIKYITDGKKKGYIKRAIDIALKIDFGPLMSEHVVGTLDDYAPAYIAEAIFTVEDEKIFRECIKEYASLLKIKDKHAKKAATLYYKDLMEILEE